jgi:cation diffusion facilitator CzcD-associated flavoprotein CzcO
LTRILIIGAGLGGIGLGVRLMRAGLRDFTILERASDLGGVWRDNHYPGAACDIPAALYSYSFTPNTHWSTSYPPQAEILRYIRQVADRFGVTAHLRLGQTVRNATWLEADGTRQEGLGRWQVDAVDSQGRVQMLACDLLVSAVGIFNTPMVPRIAGQDQFKGLAFHSTQWRHDVNYAGQRVALVGTGASAIQILPELVRMGAHVTLYQRTPPYVNPKIEIDMARPQEERARLTRDFDAAADRRFDAAANAALQAQRKAEIAARVRDPALRAQVTPDFTMGCKRSVFSNVWYEVLQSPQVQLVTAGLEAITPTGVRTRDGTERATDVIVYATGFEPSNYLPGLDVCGRAGASLAATWGGNPEAYLGMCVHGFPNFFMLYGPNTNVPGSVLHMLECQAQYVVQMVQTLQASGSKAVEVSAAAQRNWCEAVQAELQDSTHAAGQCQSYYMNAQGRVVTQYPRNGTRYAQETQTLRAEDFLWA